jgi:hypothetical protein
MEPKDFWKTSSLNKELTLSGIYIYNGLKAFDEMETFNYTEEIFELLYAISVGIERLQKVAIILKENITPEKQTEFEKGLINHNHLVLMKRIVNSEKKDISSLCYAFLQLLTKFYKSWRYDRFSFSGDNNFEKEKVAFIKFIEKYLNIKIKNEPFCCTSNGVRYKKFIGRTVGKIVDYLYEIIKRESFRLNVYTYETRIKTKAHKIFICKEYDFIDEDVLFKELLIFILHNVDINETLKVYKSIEPLELDEGMMVEMVKSLKSDLYKQDFLGMLEELYCDGTNVKERLRNLEVIGNENVFLTPDENNEDDI